MSAKEFYPEKVVKYCPVCGASGFSFDGIKKFACLQCSFVRYVNPTCGVMAIIKNKIDEILMVKRAQDPGK
jgi:ribosomal protein S27AE